MFSYQRNISGRDDDDDEHMHNMYTQTMAHSPDTNGINNFVAFNENRMNEGNKKSDSKQN